MTDQGDLGDRRSGLQTRVAGKPITKQTYSIENDQAVFHVTSLNVFGFEKPALWLEAPSSELRNEARSERETGRPIERTESRMS
jgi:hypothetical protein